MTELTPELLRERLDRFGDPRRAVFQTPHSSGHQVARRQRLAKALAGQLASEFNVSAQKALAVAKRLIKTAWVR